ncbi:MAG: transposase [Proteobacteria bacterium]|nr:transposase [Pseudomonadota bacterium]
MRYVSDSTDEEWEIIGPFLARCSTVGRPSIHSMRAIWECIQYQATTGCQWRMLPKNFAPFTTV